MNVANLTAIMKSCSNCAQQRALSNWKQRKWHVQHVHNTHMCSDIYERDQWMTAILRVRIDEMERQAVNRDGYANAQRKQSAMYSSRPSFTGEMAPRWVENQAVSRCSDPDC